MYYCAIENFRLIISKAISLSVSAAAGIVTIVTDSPDELLAYANTRPYKILTPFGAIVPGLDLRITGAGQMTFTADVDDFPSFVANDPVLTGQPCIYSVPAVYAASVDEISEIRIGPKTGMTETRLIDLEGRWLAAVPKLVPDNRYDAALLTDGGNWTNGTFKHVPRTRSRFGLESYFGSPLLGSFTPIQMTSATAVADLAATRATLDVAKTTNQFNYQGWL